MAARAAALPVTAPSGKTLQRFEREEFINERWAYERGNHVIFIGPTQCGKTTLQFQLLQKSITPDLPAVIFGQKPRDETVDKWAPRLGLKEIKTWPPPLHHKFTGAPPGYLLRPATVFDPKKDDVHHHAQYRAAMLDCFKRGEHIVVPDELYDAKRLGLEQELIALWTKGEAMHAGQWGTVQKPSHIPSWGFNNSAHVFLYNDPDRRNIKRYAEIGGIDTKLLEETVESLPDHESLYLRRKGRVACIVGP